jgi:molybdate transport system substrate-binding protein
MRRIGYVARIAAMLTLLCMAAGSARAADLFVMSSGAFTGAYHLLAPEFEKLTGHKLHYTYGTSMGTAPEAMPSRLQRGEPADVLILIGSQLAPLIQQGYAVPGSKTDLAVSRIGMVTRADLPKPEIATVGAVRAALLAAPSIGYSSSASGTFYATDIVQRLGIAEQVLPKSKRIGGGERVASAVARGDVALGLQQVSEIAEVLQGPEGEKLAYLGPLPDDLQQVNEISAGLATAAREPAIARAFIAFLRSPDAQAKLQQVGLDPVVK